MKKFVYVLLTTTLVIFATVGILDTFTQFESPRIQTATRVKQVLIRPKGTDKEVCITLKNSFKQ